VTTARAAGVSPRRLQVAHALPAALPTYLTALGIQAGSLLGGAVLVEAVFSWPGLGQLAAQAIDRRDYPVVQVLLLLSVAVFVIIQLSTDLVHAYLDPRVRIGGLT
jgi:peptide/nickel transport system permease protein